MLSMSPRGQRSLPGAPMSNATTPRLEIGAAAPNFTLPAVTGDGITRSSYRARKHLVLIVLPFVDLSGREYLEEVRERYAAFRASDGEVLALITDPGTSAEGLRAAIDVPFPLLLDPGGAAASRLLPDGASHGVIVLDRYATVRAQWTLTAPPLPTVDEIVAWIDAIDRQCVL
jgi:peroxiredoxin